MTDTNFKRDFAEKYTQEHIALVNKMVENGFYDQCKELSQILWDARERGSMIYIMGNGGSASTSTHMMCDLGKGTIIDGFDRFRVIAITDNIATMLAWGNDDSYESIFVEQLKNLMQEGDVVVGISGSGNSMNVINGITWANEHGGFTVGLAGYDGGKLEKSSKFCITVPCFYMQQVEDIHMFIEHLVTSMIREEEMALNKEG